MTVDEFQAELQKIRIKNGWEIQLNFHKVWEVVVVDVKTGKALAISGAAGLRGVLSLLQRPLDSDLWNTYSDPEPKKQKAPSPKPKVVCLCGSGKFKSYFMEINRQETANGNIVLMPGVFLNAGDVILAEDKEKLDELHLRKIDMADEVYVINEDGYIGESTRNEVEYAKSIGKLIRYLEEKGGER